MSDRVRFLDVEEVCYVTPGEKPVIGKGWRAVKETSCNECSHFHDVGVRCGDGPYAGEREYELLFCECTN